MDPDSATYCFKSLSNSMKNIEPISLYWFFSPSTVFVHHIMRLHSLSILFASFQKFKLSPHLIIFPAEVSVLISRSFLHVSDGRHFSELTAKMAAHSACGLFVNFFPSAQERKASNRICFPDDQLVL